ncbi:Transmembrane protein 208 [Rhynchospora pubera]|uniref:Transmembrane protein 208 n=1 Tax=Rhynchospora pubera TaxID=906938 RepID=A0AAV8AQV9_9POAL|nr:Transmembrane protein 208 [Rhynchospora pubera]KAJ4746667.1 Transmembrane protein 208 [Rhynchospora pubera]
MSYSYKLGQKDQQLGSFLENSLVFGLQTPTHSNPRFLISRRHRSAQEGGLALERRIFCGESKGNSDMANQGAKKRKEENKKHMSTLLRVILASNVIYIILRMLIMHSSFTWKHWIGLLITSAAYFFPYKQLDNMSKPAYSEDGELLDGGYDMSTGGVCGYLHDVIYITVFVQIASIISGKFWWTYLVIPGFGAYKAFGLIKGTFFGGSEDGPKDEKSRKKREKMEKKASRGKFVKTRAR